MSQRSKLMGSVFQGRWDFFRSCAIHSPLSGAEFQKTAAGTTYYSSGIDYAPCNGIMEESERDLPEKEIRHAIDFFNSKKLPFIWWTAAKNLDKKGFQYGGILTGIALDISQGIPNQKRASSGPKIKIVKSKTELQVFSEMAVNIFGMGGATTLEQFQAVSLSAMKQGEQLHFLAYLNETPVGTATLSICPSSAGIWNLATLPEYRKHGIGTALVQEALVESNKRQYQEVMAILMPKGLAWGLFAKHGFKEICHFPFYVYGVSADKLEK